jgi:hypothetical protein
MARPTRYRTPRQLAVVAESVLTRYASEFGWTRAMPVPIEQIIERLYRIGIEWHELDEPPGTSVLGALDPAARTIVLNRKHEQMLSDVLGPYEFTLGHELGHWLFDADDPNQLSLLDSQGERFCHSRNSPAMSQQQQNRETNANRFAAELLMPADLVLRVDEKDLVANMVRYAVDWNVSRTALRIRLETLGILDGESDNEPLW